MTKRLAQDQQNDPICCIHDFCERFQVPEIINTVTSAKPIAISYDTICAEARIAPKNAYLESDAQPAKNHTIYTDLR